ncbi:hypothetical protein [Streptomyces ziwulingensis]|uniref:Gamma-butyrolactone-binding regulator SlbR n=1 Tax=Streptomyces ziwulingensis TaxID=1045501 RepID=A0ABP9CPX8_9ACTN
MSETLNQATEVASQYASQVAGDLGRNAKEQERLGAEIAALQDQLVALQRDHGVLVNLQQALGTTAAAAASPDAGSDTEGTGSVPRPRGKAAAERTAGKRTRANTASTASTASTKKPAKGQERTAKKSPAAKATAKTAAEPSVAPEAKADTEAPAKPSSKPSTKPAAKSVAKPAARTTAAKKPAVKKDAAPTLGALIHSLLATQGEPRSAAEVATALGEAHPERPVKTTVVRNTLEGLVAKGQVQRSKQGTSVFYTAPSTSGAATAAEAGTEAAPAPAE